MAKRYLDDWLKAFVSYASFGEAPLKMLFWTGVATIAGALRRKVWIDQKYFQWIPNFYIIFVAPPGIVSKSTTANVGMNLLRQIKEIKFGPDVITWQQLVKSLSESTQQAPNPHKPGEFFPMSAVTFCSDELGNLLNPADRDLIDALVTLWDGKQGVFRKETKFSGKESIENPFVNIIGCTTPEWISGTFPEYMIGGGFTSRCVFVYAEQKRRLVPYVDEHVPPDFAEMSKRLVHDLEIISTLFGEVKISEEARAWGRKWYEEHWREAPKSLTHDQLKGYVARKQTHIHKLAIVLSASESSSLVIEKHHLMMANELVTALEADMPKVFSRIGQTPVTRSSFEIISLVERHPGISQTELFRYLFRTLSYKDFLEALASAVNTLRIRSVAAGNEVKYYPAGYKEPKDEPQDIEIR